MANWPEFRPVPLIRALVAHGVDFVIVGGIAMVLQGSTRATQDLDICFDPSQANLDALGGTLVELGARLRGVSEDVPFVPDGRSLRQISIVTLDTVDGPLDLLRDPSGAPPYDQLRRAADRMETDGMAILVASLDDLESMKRAAGRAKDQLDLDEIEVIRRIRARGGADSR